MKSKFDLKHGIARLLPENADDLWILSDVITPGAHVTARTLRSIEVRRGAEKEKVGKRTVLLTIAVEKIELNECLRLGGKIIEAQPEIGRGWHTVEVSAGTQLTVQKSWKNWEIEKIKSAAKKAEPVFVCILDETEADFYVVRERIEHLLHVSGGTLKKKTGAPREYYGNVAAVLKEKSGLAKYIVLAGPGFAKEDLQKFLKERAKEIFEKIFVDSVSQTGMQGLHELFKRKMFERIARESRIVEETAAVELLLAEIAKDGKAVYGFEETGKALEAGAVETLLVSDKKVRACELLLELAEKSRARILIVSSLHPAGERLQGLGGIAGILRYKIY